MWFDKTPLSYTHWRAGRPTIKNEKFLAGLSTDGFWDIKTFNVIEETLYFHQHSILACKIEMGKYSNIEFSFTPGEEYKAISSTSGNHTIKCFLCVQSCARCSRG